MRMILSYMMAAVLFLTAAASFQADAQTSIKPKSMCFVYVAHSENTSVSSLVEYLDSRYERAVQDKEFTLIIYMANMDEPLIVEVNTPSDNRDSYNALISELKGGRSYHPVYPDYDLERLVELFEVNDFVADGSNVLDYRSVDWHFHVTSDFWNKGYNESLIASLCFVMGVEHFESDNFRLRCYFSRYDDLKYDMDYPFGQKNYCDMDFKPYYY
jgi:hypothetical protein